MSMPLHALHADWFAAPLLVALWTVRGPLRHSGWPAVVALAYFGVVHGATAVANIRTPHVWDYACFWLYGHIAAAHLNIYDPAVFARFPLPFASGDDFTSAVIRVGFPYPPPTIALFLPLGYIDSIPAGLAVWYAVQFVALAVAARILATRFTPERPWTGTAFIAALTLALPATASNVYDAQTNFLLLAVVALALVTGGGFWGGVWTMLCVWVKPYTALLLLGDLVRGNVRALFGAAATAAISLAGAFALLGPQTMWRFVHDGPAGREPAEVFVEPANESLLAVILRRHVPLPEHISILHEPAFVAIAIILTAVTAILVARAPRRNDLAFAASLLLGMLVYPATLFSYGVMLVVPLLVLWRHRDALPGRTAAVVGLTAVVTLTQSRLPFAFVATVALWLAVTVLLAAPRRETAPALGIVAPEPVPVIAG